MVCNHLVKVSLPYMSGSYIMEVYQENQTLGKNLNIEHEQNYKMIYNNVFFSYRMTMKYFSQIITKCF